MYMMSCDLSLYIHVENEVQDVTVLWYVIMSAIPHLFSKMHKGVGTHIVLVTWADSVGKNSCWTAFCSIISQGN